MSQESKLEYRIGSSRDIHTLSLNRKLIFGGVHIPYPMGEVAHSDGDVVYHALSEAILGALALGDLGTHFPDNDPNTENMDSAIIVRYVVKKMKEAGKLRTEGKGYYPKDGDIMFFKFNVTRK